MEFILENALLVGLAIGSGLLLIWPMLSRMPDTSSNLDPADAVLLINRENALVVDVREEADFAAGHITDARHIPLDQLEGRVDELRKFKDKPVLVNCQAGMRSTKACNILKQHGFTKVFHLKGGLNAWLQAKLPVVK